MKNTNRLSSGFSLVELLVGIGIIALISVLLLPAMRSVLDRSKLAKCQNNLRQITVAGLAYVADNDGFFPGRPVGAEITNPWYVGGTLPTDTSEDFRPLNAYTDYNYKLFICPADTAEHPPVGGAAWSKEPFHKTFGCSYYYNSYAGSQKNIKAGKEESGLFGKRLASIKKPAKMVFFGDQDARAATGGANWKTLALYWHSKPNQPLRANMSFVDGSMRLVDVMEGYEDGEYGFYNKE